MKYDISLSEMENAPINIMLEHIAPGSIVLEFGPAHGRMTKVLKEQLHCTVYIVECDNYAYEEALQYAEKGLCEDIMQFGWVEAFSGTSFDYIIFADVLEHLYDPVQVLQKAKPLLKDGGSIWASVPNFAHNDILTNLYQNRFEYTPTGLLDDSHIRFFTYESLRPFAKKSGYQIVFEDVTILETNNTEQYNPAVPVSDGFFQALLLRPLGDVYEFVFELKKEEQEQGMAPTISWIGEREDVSFVRFYFDTGDGFAAGPRIEMMEKSQTGPFSYRVAVPSGTRMVRFDAGKQVTGIIRGFGVCNSAGPLPCHSNGQHVTQYDVFFDKDPQYTVDLVQNPSSMLFFSGDRLASEDALYDTIWNLASDVAQEKAQESYFGTITDLRIQAAQLQQKISYLEEKNSVVVEELRHQIHIANARATDSDKRLEETSRALQETRKRIRSDEEDLRLHIKTNIEQRNEIFSVQNELNRVCAIHSAVVSSKSWKMTWPLRAAISFAKQLGKPKAATTPAALDAPPDAGLPFGSTPGQMPLWDMEVQALATRPLVSVIVPNYNHAQFLKRRLDSIYNQSYQNIEVILMDDCSTDNSRGILKQYAEKYPSITQLVFNETNSGRVSRQWKKGLALASGQYVWIAESDDSCSLDFLEEMVELLRHESVMLAFAKSLFVQGDREVWAIEEYLHDMKTISWDKPFMATAHMLVRHGFAKKNFIPNVSSAVFRNPSTILPELEPLWEEVTLVHDWLFYLCLIKGGTVAYTNQGY